MTRQQKTEHWRKRIEASESFAGSEREYCDSQGLSLATFRYWKSKLRVELPAGLVMPTSPFVRVEIERPRPQSKLPDAKWVAEVLMHLSRGLG